MPSYKTQRIQIFQTQINIVLLRLSSTGVVRQRPGLPGRWLSARRRCPCQTNADTRTLVESLSVGRAAVLETGPLLCRRRTTSLEQSAAQSQTMYGQFRRLLKTFLFGQWGHGEVWTVFLTTLNRHILTYLLHDAVCSDMLLQLYVMWEM